MQLYRKSLTAGSGELVSMSAYGAVFGFVPLPRNYGLALFGMMLVYIPLTQYVKSWYVRRYGI